MKRMCLVGHRSRSRPGKGPRRGGGGGSESRLHSFTNISISSHYASGSSFSGLRVVHGESVISPHSAPSAPWLIAGGVCRRIRSIMSVERWLC
jgi:hypothetical protein